MKFFVGTFVIYLVVTDKWRIYKDFATVGNPAGQAATTGNISSDILNTFSPLGIITNAAKNAFTIFKGVSGLFK